MLLSFLGKYREGGLLLMRLGLGVMLLVYGAAELFAGPHHWAVLGTGMRRVGVDNFPKFWGFMAAFATCFGGFFLIFGLLFRVACLLLALTMAVAAIGAWKRGDHLSRALELTFVFAGLLFVGPGKYSVDKG